MPKEWYNYCAAQSNPETSHLVANKKPYFFIYIYPKTMHEYRSYINKTNKTCIMRFGMTIEKLISLSEKSKEQEEYLKYYYSKMPVSLGNSVMNRICRKIENEFKDYKVKNDIQKFDSAILKSDVVYTKGRYNAIKELYNEYKIQLSAKMKHNNSNKNDNSDKQIEFNDLKCNFKNKAFEICNNEQELCNIVIDLCYKNNLSKQFAWDICGDRIIQNLLEKNNKITYPVEDSNGNILFGGRLFSMVEKEVNIENHSE
jgi:hypothetical protein